MMNNQMIKQELLQYTARLIEASPLQNNTNPGATRHDVAALLVEQALELGLNQEQTHDLFIVKPILKATLIIIKERVALMDSIGNYDLNLVKIREEYLQTISTLEKILEQLNK